MSIGSNDLFQYLFAADRSNERVATRFDSLSRIFLQALANIVEAGSRHKVPVALCGEVGGRPLEALALIALGIRSLSMAPASIGPVKAMVLSLHAQRAQAYLRKLLREENGSLRDKLKQFAESEGVQL